MWRTKQSRKEVMPSQDIPRVGEGFYTKLSVPNEAERRAVQAALRSMRKVVYRARIGEQSHDEALSEVPPVRRAHHS